MRKKERKEKKWKGDDGERPVNALMGLSQIYKSINFQISKWTGFFSVSY